MWLETGAVEVHARELLLLNDARTLPFQLETVSTDALASEDLRLKYRYLDLRRPQLQANLRLRHRVLREIRHYMDEQGFTEIETPILIKSTRRCARLHRPVARATRKVLCVATVSAVVQAVVHDRWSG